MTGVIEANSSKEFIVSFSPDHQSQAYAETINIKLNGQTAYTFNIVGQAWANNMYSVLAPQTQREDKEHKNDLKVKPVNYEYMAASARDLDEAPPPPEALILIFIHHVGDQSGVGVAPTSANKERSGSGRSKTNIHSGVGSRAKVVKEVEVGCVKSALVKKVRLKRDLYNNLGIL